MKGGRVRCRKLEERESDRLTSRGASELEYCKRPDRGAIGPPSGRNMDGDCE
jgi:hypothetical protein